LIDIERKNLFDNWALQYDPAASSLPGQYPFDGYENALSSLVFLAEPEPGLIVLDLGTGTGNLAGRFASRGCTVWGIDFSEKMIDKARAMYSEIEFVYADLLSEWPQKLPTTFDIVVSAYVFHEFDMSNKLKLINRVVEKYLKPTGRILIADIAFPSIAERAAAADRWSEKWDESEHYWAADETFEVIENAGFKMQFQQVSSCYSAQKN
jgi:ubiquinone/menaquinone biosynthesis C-methylase UbiE